MKVKSGTRMVRSAFMANLSGDTEPGGTEPGIVLEDERGRKKIRHGIRSVIMGDLDRWID